MTGGAERRSGMSMKMAPTWPTRVRPSRLSTTSDAPASERQCERWEPIRPRSQPSKNSRAVMGADPSSWTMVRTSCS